MKQTFIFAILMFFAFARGFDARAGAMVEVKGELYSINQYDIQIKTSSSILRIDRSQLTPSQQRQLEIPGISGKIVQLDVPMTAIKQGRPLTSQAQSSSKGAK
jgi:hypothetical protein